MFWNCCAQAAKTADQGVVEVPDQVGEAPEQEVLPEVFSKIDSATPLLQGPAGSMVRCETPPRLGQEAGTAASGDVAWNASEGSGGASPKDQDAGGTSTKSIKIAMQGIPENEPHEPPEFEARTSSGKAVSFGQAEDAPDRTKVSFGQNASGGSGGRSATLPRCQSKAFSEASTLATEWDPTKGLRREDSLTSVQAGLSDVYTTVSKLGQGGFGTVWHVKKIKNTREQYACKSIPFKNVEDAPRFEVELGIARKLQHPHIIRLHQFFRDAQGYHLVMELCTGGDLLERLRYAQEQVLGPCPAEAFGFPTETVARYLWQMLSGLAYMHHYRFAHRDIKPENYLLANKMEEAPLKLVDFGLARSFKKGELMTSKVGTPHYVAPEVLNGKGYDTKCDVWSTGAVAFTISLGKQPFTGVTEKDLFDNIIKGEVDFSEATWRWHSKELVDILKQMMKVDPKERATAKEILKGSAWLRKMAFYQDDCCCCFG